MYTVIAIEGIDRIGKSTFINTLKEKLEEYSQNETSDKIPVVIEKPTIGINTLHSMNYPLADVPGIMEIRNIGLMEEFLYRCQKAKEDGVHKIIIRDRFNLSEMAYGEIYRHSQMAKIMGMNPTEPEDEFIELYQKWNGWFETEMDKAARVVNVTFVLDSDSYPNEDEAISASMLVPVNEKFDEVSNRSVYDNNFCFRLHKDPETGMTNIMDFIQPVFARVLFLTYKAIV